MGRLWSMWKGSRKEMTTSASSWTRTVSFRRFVFLWFERKERREGDCLDREVRAELTSMLIYRSADGTVSLLFFFCDDSRGGRERRGTRRRQTGRLLPPPPPSPLTLALELTVSPSSYLLATGLRSILKVLHPSQFVPPPASSFSLRRVEHSSSHTPSSLPSPDNTVSTTVSASLTMTITGSPHPTRMFETTLLPIETKISDSSFYGNSGSSSSASREVSLGVGIGGLMGLGMGVLSVMLTLS